MEQLLMTAIAKYPMLVTVFMIMGILRAVFKPIMSVLQAYVLATPDTKDDVALDGFMHGKIYSSVAWVLDYTASIKLPKPMSPGGVVPNGNSKPT